jgi:uncharacterized delta-60 repeat protein
MSAPKQGAHARRTAALARPRLEGLEARDVPAVIVGTLDQTFGTAGKLNTPAGFQAVLASGVDNFGRVVVAGTAPGAGGGDMRIVRFNKDGTPDTTFNNGAGSIQIDIGGGFDQAAGIALDPSGNIAVVGTSTVPGGQQRAAIISLGADGRPRGGFGPGGSGGEIITSPMTSTSLNAAAFDANGNIVVVGSGFNSPGLSFYIIGRINPITGAFDPAFNKGTIQAIAIFKQSNDIATAVNIDPNGNIVVSGDSTPQSGLRQAAIVRLLPNGSTLDPSFNKTGVFVFSTPGSTSDLVRAATLDPANNLYVGIDSGPVGKLSVAKVSPNGALDTSFGVGGVFVTQFLGAVGNPATAGVVVTPTGQVVLAGTVQTGTSPPGVDFAVVQLTRDGTIDTGFDNNSASPGTLLVDFAGHTDVARSLTRRPDGKLVVVGVDTSDNNVEIAQVVGLNGSGRAVIASGTPDGNAVLFPQDPANPGLLNGANPIPLRPFGTTSANIRSVVADVNGDGTDDYILVTGPGEATRFAVVDGRDNTTFIVKPVDPFGNVNFTGGAFVAAGDINNDGRAEIVITPDQGGGPNVVVFSLNPDGSLSSPKSFFAFGNPSFRGGARPAMGDINGDSRADIAIGAGFLGGPNVEIHDGMAVANGDFTTLVLPAFFAFNRSDAASLRNGVFLSIGDINGDGFADLIAGGGPGGGPRVLVLDGRMLSEQNIAGAYANPVANFFFGDPNDRGGVRVAAVDADGDFKADLAVGSGEGLPSHVRVYFGKSINDRGEPAQFQDLDPYNQTLPGGVFVG